MFIELPIGSVLVLIGLMLLVRPQIADWVNDQTNLRMVEWYSAPAKYEENLKRYRKDMWILRAISPAFFLLVGTVVILRGAGILD